MSIYSLVDNLITIERDGIYFFRAGKQVGELQAKLAIHLNRQFSYTECITAGIHRIIMRAGLYAKKDTQLVIGIGQIYGYQFGSSVIVRNYEMLKSCTQAKSEKYHDFVDRAIGVLVQSMNLDFVVFVSRVDSSGFVYQHFCGIPSQ